MIEKETVAPEERRLVSAVIYNRLRNGMPLGIDATIRYGRNVPGTEPLKQSDLDSDSPYNSRRRLGLPPTPISNPGLASIRAAARPARVDYLFFVRKPDGVHHFFTASESEFFRRSASTASAAEPILTRGARSFFPTGHEVVPPPGRFPG